MKYHKIQTVFHRDPETKFRTLLDGQFSEPEFEYLKDNEWVFTEKVDGTNIRVTWDYAEGRVSFGGRTNKSSIPTFLLGRLQELFTPASLAGLPSCTLFGEGYGNKIQKVGSAYLDHADFILFDVSMCNDDGQYWLERDNVDNIAAALGIKSVPAVGTGTLLQGVEMVRVGFKSPLGNVTSEGLIMRPAIEMKTRLGRRVITKIKHKDFAGNKVEILSN